MSRPAQPARYVEVASLKPYERNARQHSAVQIEQIKQSIRKFGFVGVLAYDDRGLAIGHGRQQALLEMWEAGEEVWGPGKREFLPTGKAPAIDITGLSDDERAALIIADNQLALNASWDEDLLSAELRALMDSDFSVGVMGFDEEYLSQLVSGATIDPEDEEVPEPPENPVSRPGDLWVLGQHRIICGSCTDKETITVLLGEEKPHLMVTDPPYGVNYEPGWREEQNKMNESFRNATRKFGKVENDDRADWREAWELFEGDVAYIWHSGNKADIVAESIKACGFEIRAQIIWTKQHFVIGRGDYHPKHEPLYYAVRKGRPGHYIGGRKQTTVWEIDALMPIGRKGSRDSHVGDEKTNHGTQKPLECMRRPIENNSKIGDSIYEPFSGSGTTIIACELTGRRCLAIELNPAYVDVAVHRWEQHSGRKATLGPEGPTFADVAAERAAEAEKSEEPA